jgi:hypothetical protein
MRLEITKLTALHPQGYFVQWTLHGATESGVYGFQLYRSGGSAGPWDLVADVSDQYAFVDHPPAVAGGIRPNAYALHRAIYYKVVALTPSRTVLEAVAEVAPGIEGRLAGQHRKAVRDFERATRKFGIPIVVLKRRSWGVRCACIDPVTKNQAKAACVICFGTGFSGGYWTPVKTWGRKAANDESTAYSGHQVDEATSFKVWLPALPLVERDDVLFFPRTQERCRIDKVTRTEIQHAPIHQLFVVQALDRSHALFRLKLDDAVEPLL